MVLHWLQIPVFFPISYTKVSYWITKGMATLGIPGHWTSHGLRRGGASELLRLGVALNEIAMHGRWLSERSMREYLRRGEVAVLRLRGEVPVHVWRHIAEWANVGPRVWDLVSVFKV